MTTTQKRLYRELVLIVAICVMLFPASRAAGHCDTLNGPVALTGRTALESGDVTPVLKSVSASDEPEVRSALARARVVRVQGDDANALAGQFFPETLCRSGSDEHGAEDEAATDEHRVARR